MRYWFVILLLAGCGSGDEASQSVVNDNHGYGFQADVQGSGMSLRYSPVLSASDPHAAIAFYESEFKSVEQCTNISSTLPPFVIVVNIGDLGTGDFGVRANGLYFSNPSLIVIDTTVFALRHEMIHYLLESTGDSDGNHKSHFFKVVADGGCA